METLAFTQNDIPVELGGKQVLMFNTLTCEGDIELPDLKHEVCDDVEGAKPKPEKRRKTKPVDLNSHKPKKINLSVVKKLKTINSGFERTIVENYYLINGKRYVLRTMITDIEKMDDEKKAVLLGSKRVCKPIVHINSQKDSQPISSAALLD